MIKVKNDPQKHSGPGAIRPENPKNRTKKT